MKHFLLPASFFFSFLSTSVAQSGPGPVERKVTDNICTCITALDIENIQDKQSAEKAFVNCFSQEAGSFVQLAAERKIEITDQAAMKNLGTDIGKNLLNQNCQGFMQLSMAMVKETEAGTATGVTEGRLKRLDTKDFNYFVITDSDNKEKSFIWLRQFPGSESFTQDAAKLVGKKIRINWQEMEVFIPSAKNYYTIREVVELKIL
jgi:hypothetical protein